VPRSRERSADADSATAIYFKEVSRHPLLSREEEQRLARAYRDKGDVIAGHKLVTSNLRFVIKIAFQFRRNRLRIADLIQEGNIGLIKAVEKFDPDRGVRFLTYAVWQIRAYMRKFIISQRNLVRLGTTGTEQKIFFSMGRVREELARQGRIHPDAVSMKKIAQRLGVKPADVAQMAQRLGRSEVSLSQLISDAPDSLTTRQDMLEDEALLPDAQFEESEKQEFLHDEVLKISLTLDERERRILLHRLMADEGDRWTLDQLGKDFGLSRERIRQIEERLKKKLRILLSRTLRLAQKAG